VLSQAVAGTHSRPEAVESTLLDQGVTVTVGGMELTEGTPMTLAVGEDIPWSISGGPAWKGVLVRLELAGRNADATGALSTTSPVLRFASGIRCAFGARRIAAVVNTHAICLDVVYVCRAATFARDNA